MRPEELAAGQMVARCIGATLNGDPATGNHDVDLTLPNGRTVGMEVTTATDADEVRTWAAIDQRRGEGDTELTRWWSVAIHSGVSVKQAHREVPRDCRAWG